MLTRHCFRITLTNVSAVTPPFCDLAAFVSLQKLCDRVRYVDRLHVVGNGFPQTLSLSAWKGLQMASRNSTIILPTSRISAYLAIMLKPHTRSLRSHKCKPHRLGYFDKPIYQGKSTVLRFMTDCHFYHKTTLNVRRVSP